MFIHIPCETKFVVLLLLISQSDSHSVCLFGFFVQKKVGRHKCFGACFNSICKDSFLIEIKLLGFWYFQIEAAFGISLAAFRLDSFIDYGNELQDNKAANLINGYYSYLMNVVQPRMQEMNRQRKEEGYLTYPYLIPRWIPNGVQA